MAHHVFTPYTPGSTLGYSVKRLADGFYYDFSNATFTAAPVTQVSALAEGTGNYAGEFSATIASTPSGTWTNGQYKISIHNTVTSANTVLQTLTSVMYNGDDAPVFPSGSGSDPWATAIPSGYGPGTAGYVLGAFAAPPNFGLLQIDGSGAVRLQYGTSAGQVNLSGGNLVGVVTVGTVNDKTGYSLAGSQTFSTSGAVGSVSGAVGSVAGNVVGTVGGVTGGVAGSVGSVAAPVTVGTVNDKTGYTLALSQTFSTSGSVGSVAAPVTAGTVTDKAGYALSASQTFSTSGSVGGVAAAVTVGTVNDKAGYSLAPSGVDAVLVESGVNLRQAVALVGAACVGAASGLLTATATYYAMGNPGTARIAATVDGFGNRTALNLTKPA